VAIQLCPDSVAHNHAVLQPLCATDLFLSLQEADENTAIQTVHTAYQAGINLFDVSPYYGSGRAEQVCGGPH